MSGKGVYGTAGDTGFRRKWDTEEYRQRALEREEAEKQGSGKGNKRLRDDDADGPKTLLKGREGKLDLTSNLNKTQVIQAGTGTLGQAGFRCEICEMVFKDNLNYLDHLNGLLHQRNLGMSLKVERSTTEQVLAKLESLKDKKEQPFVDLRTRVKIAEEKERLEKEQKKEVKKQKKKQKKEEAEAKQEEFFDGDIAAMMGFGSFGGSKEKNK
ncbi:hypothetical protein HDU97_006690 [Phlyctochytrium planicorne]|nr:hypothetical protein HDU97_006690 [Phlyctochytrium planicorne]